MKVRIVETYWGYAVEEHDWLMGWRQVGLSVPTYKEAVHKAQKEFRIPIAEFKA